MKRLSVLLLAKLWSGCGGYSAPRVHPAGRICSSHSSNCAQHGGPAFTLTVNGNTFNANAVVNWDGLAQTSTTHPAMNQLTVAIPASAIATAGTVALTVTNPGSNTPGGPWWWQ
jgi:hypothetical protein